MAFTDLTAVIDIMRDENTTFFTDYTDEELTALKRSGALKRLRIDIVNEMNLADGSDAIMDEVVSKYADRLNNALTLLQLQMFYFENNDGEGSITYERYLSYTTRYNDLRSKFNEMKIDIATNYITTITKFKIG